STNYTWTVQDKVTHAPIQWAYYTLTLSNMTTLANGERNVVLTDWADSSGQFQTVLPPGTHRYRVSRSGYPTTFFDISVPSPASTIFELEPPGSISCSFQDQDTGGMLNPAPAGAALRLSGHVGGYSAEGHGDWMGLEMEEVMPGAYTGTVSAVGYEDFPVSLVVTGGVTNAFEFVLDPLPRGTITGSVQDSGSPVEGATVKVSGFSSLQYETASDGSFSITNVPYGSRTCVVKKDGYRTAVTPVSVSQSSQSVGIVALQAISDEELNLGAWTTTCFNRVEEVPGTFFGPGYKVTCSFGVFDATASLFTERSGNAAVLDSLLLDIEGFKWYYYSVSSSFSLADLAFAQLDDVSSAVGDLCMTMVDLSPAASGFFSFLSVNIGAGGCGGQTVVRVDRVVILEDGSPVWDSYERLDQRYSTSSPLSYAIDTDVSDITEVVIRIYVKVTNENYCIGPLFLRDKIRFEWKWDGNGFKFQKPKTNPSDYPSFSFD
ncbi:MAG: carboxypeptidase-like regulatory domain-containing protein, partial [Kiritimatiellales bacterium]|nr:carboxypeptidase-like regulatory domain-containing protein [Kiritimatiellales bacterium]